MASVLLLDISHFIMNYYRDDITNNSIITGKINGSLNYYILITGENAILLFLTITTINPTNITMPKYCVYIIAMIYNTNY